MNGLSICRICRGISMADHTDRGSRLIMCRWQYWPVSGLEDGAFLSYLPLFIYYLSLFSYFFLFFLIHILSLFSRSCLIYHCNFFYLRNWYWNNVQICTARKGTLGFVLMISSSTLTRAGLAFSPCFGQRGAAVHVVQDPEDSDPIGMP